MKRLKKILMLFIWIILILLVSFNVYNFVSIKLLHNDLAKVNGYALLEVVSGSMEPTLKVGDLIIINTNFDNYEKDDIITFRDVNGSFVTHRIIEIDDSTMVTKGDANPSLDEEMPRVKIVGKYVTRIPGAGKVMASLKNPVVMVLILLIGIICCFLGSTDENLLPKDLTEEEKEFLEYKKRKEEKEKKDKKEEAKEEVTQKKTSPKQKATTKESSKKSTTKSTTKTTPKKKEEVKKTTKKTENSKKSSTINKKKESE